ncbi:hypothetical protein HZS_7452, partial [Henneguya salminicola]
NLIRKLRGSTNSDFYAIENNPNSLTYEALQFLRRALTAYIIDTIFGSQSVLYQLCARNLIYLSIPQLKSLQSFPPMPNYCLRILLQTWISLLFSSNNP